jgi:hypothetical protein
MGYSLVQLARIDAARGDRDRCATRTERARREVEMRGVGCLAVYSAAALGRCALGSGDFAIAVDHLERAWMLTRADGMENPNVVPFGGDLVEALARIGEIARASEILAWLEERAETTGLRYPRIAAARGRAVIEEDPSAAQEGFVRALSTCEGPPMPFEQARTLLCQGGSLRRARQPAAAREPLRRALMIFRSLGNQPWITRTVTELGAAGVRGVADRPDRGRHPAGRAHPAGTADRPGRRAGPEQRGGRGGPVRVAQDRRGPSDPRLSQARRQVPHGADPDAAGPRHL